jgi:diguanylate cyclase (GGDEF)-like protein/PAS domain S-box-containing protein
MMRTHRLRAFLRGGIHGDPDHVVRLTGLLFCSAAVVGVISLLLPHARGADHVGLAVLIAAAFATGVVLAALPGRVPLGVLHPLIFSGSVMIAAGIYFTGTADSPYPTMYVWTTLFTAYFFERRWVAAQVAWLLVTYGAALALLPPDSESSSVTRWLLTAIALSIAASATSWLVNRAHAAEEHAGRFFELSHDLLCTVDPHGKLVDLNSAWRTVLGHDLNTLRASSYRDIVHPDDWEGVAENLRAVFAGADAGDQELRMQDSRGGWHWIAWTATYSPAQRLVYARGTDVTEQRRMVDELHSQARTDPLTGIPNRRWLAHELGRELARARRKGYPLSIAMLDVDHFKRFNDVCGHPAGDRFLREAAQAWRGALRISDFIARYGGEEFVVLLPDCDLEEAFEIAERVRAVTPLEQTCSAGVTTWTGHESAEGLIQRADDALYRAKAEGRDRSVAERSA